MRIGIVCNLSSPTTDYYRTVNPFIRLREVFPQFIIKMINPDTVKWYDFYDVDVVIFQRANGNDLLGMINEVKRMGKKIILDHDDLLHEVSAANPASQHFNKPQVKESVEKAFKYADWVMTSTPYLKEFYSQFYDKDKITIVPNAIDFTVTPMQPVKRDKLMDAKKRVMWRGSQTHLEDLATVKNFWIELQKNDKVELGMVGLADWLGKTLYPKAIIVPWNNSLFQYFEMVKNSAPHYGVFPLTNDNFNQAKSNNFAMEMLVAGCISYAPEEIKEFNIAGVRTYKNELDLIHKFTKALVKDDAYFVDLEAGRKWLQEERDLKKINILRLAIMESI